MTTTQQREEAYIRSTIKRIAVAKARQAKALKKGK